MSAPDARLLTQALADPATALQLDADGWNALLRMARSQMLLSSLAARLRAADLWPLVPSKARAVMMEHEAEVADIHVKARFETAQVTAILRDLAGPVVLLKGSAYLVAGLSPAAGRQIGDLDLLLPRDQLESAEALLLDHGWTGIKTSAYDDAYYRQHMHELPPLAHAGRGTVVDLHHSILPLTARIRPDAGALLAAAQPTAVPGAFMLAPADMLLHSVAHLFYDGDFQGGLRNLWDIACLIEDFRKTPGFWQDLAARARLHQLEIPLGRALRHARTLFNSRVDPALAGQRDWLDPLIAQRLCGLDAYGQTAAPLAARLLYIRSHWLRMPPLMLARHLFTKWRMKNA